MSKGDTIEDFDPSDLLDDEDSPTKAIPRNQIPPEVVGEEATNVVSRDSIAEARKLLERSRSLSKPSEGTKFPTGPRAAVTASEEPTVLKPPPAKPPPASTSGSHSTVGATSGKPVGPAPGQVPRGTAAPGPTTQPPARPPSGPASAARPPSGEHARPLSGQHARPPSGEHARPPSGPFPASSSGSFPTAASSGNFPAAQSTEVPVLSGRGQEYYYLPTGHTGRQEAIVAPRQRTAGRALLRGVGFALPVALSAAAALAYLCVNRWLGPQQLILWTIIGLSCPVVFFGIIAAWPPEGQKQRKSVWIAGLLPALVLAAAGAVGAFAWHDPTVRTYAFDYVPSQPEVLSKVWADPHAPLGTRACRRMIENMDDPRWRVVLMRNISLHPASAAKCLESIGSEGQRDKVVGTIIERWQKDLLTAPAQADEARLCQVATSMTELPTDASVIDARLLTCALTAQSEGAQDCCARVLTTRVTSHDDMIKRVRATLHLVAGREAAGILMSMAFHHLNLTRPQQTLASKLSFSEQPAQRATLQLACQDLAGLDDNIVPHFVASLGSTCSIDQKNVSARAEDWVPVCELTLQSLASDAALAVQEGLCRSAESVFVGTAVDSASRFVNHALRSNQRSGLGTRIDLGFAKEQETTMSQEQWAERMEHQLALMESGMSAEEAARTAGTDGVDISRFQGGPQDPNAANGAVQNIFGTLTSDSAKGFMGEGDIAKFREAAERVGMKLPEKAAEGPPGEQGASQ